MKPDRLNALTDGVVAIAITIIVLELPLPREPTFAGLRVVSPMLLAYLLSFINIGIFWNNHHHVLSTATHVDGRVLVREGQLLGSDFTELANDASRAAASVWARA